MIFFKLTYFIGLGFPCARGGLLLRWLCAVWKGRTDGHVGHFSLLWFLRGWVDHSQAGRRVEIRGLLAVLPHNQDLPKGGMVAGHFSGSSM